MTSPGFIGQRLQPGCVTLGLFEGIGIEELAPPQEGTIGLGERGLGAHRIPVIHDAGELVFHDGKSLLAGQKKMTRRPQASGEPSRMQAGMLKPGSKGMRPDCKGNSGS